MTVLLGVVSLFAVLSMIVAVIQAAAIVRVAPASEQLASFMPLGWWKFGKIEAKAGVAAAQYIHIYKRAVIAFVVFLVFGLILSGWATTRTSSAGSATNSTTLLIDTLVDPAGFAFNSDLRRAAVMPGVTSLES